MQTGGNVCRYHAIMACWSRRTVWKQVTAGSVRIIVSGLISNIINIMEATGNIPQTTRQRLTIRVSHRSLSFSTVDMAAGDNPVVYEPYALNSGISMAANLREALKTAVLPSAAYRRVMVMIDSPVLMIPVDLFREDDCAALYMYSYSGHSADAVLYNVLPDLNAVAAFAVNRDLKLVVDDNYEDAQFVCAMSPVWRYLHQRSFVGTRNKLYGYFHDEKLEIFSYNQHRFKYCNSFDAVHVNDSLYFLLYVWKQLMLKPEYDEIHLVGDIPERELLLDELRRYLQRAYVINPTGDFNRAPATRIKDMPYDLMTFYVKGR